MEIATDTDMDIKHRHSHGNRHGNMARAPVRRFGCRISDFGEKCNLIWQIVGLGPLQSDIRVCRDQAQSDLVDHGFRLSAQPCWNLLRLGKCGLKNNKLVRGITWNVMFLKRKTLPSKFVLKSWCFQQLTLLNFTDVKGLTIRLQRISKVYHLNG
jgi:hypothetical protein